VGIVATARDGLVGLDTFIEAAHEVLAEAGLDDARVSFLRDRRARSRGGLLCHVYAGTTGLRHAEPSFAWSAPDVQTPEQLRDALRRALRLQTLQRAQQRALPFDDR
jgi:hypothetical protein